MAEEKLTTLAKRLRPFIAGMVGGMASSGAFMTEGPGIDIVGQTIGLGGDTILLYNSNGTPVEEFAATGAGLTAAVAAAAAGDMIMLPSRTITMTAAITIAAGVEMRGVSRATCQLYSAADLGTALVTVNGGLTNVTVYYNLTGNNGGVWLRAITVQNADAYVSRCSAICKNTGNTPAYAIDVETGSSAYNDAYAYCTNGTAVGIRAKGASNYDLAYAADSTIAYGLSIAGGVASYTRAAAINSTTAIDIYFPSGSGMSRYCVAASSGVLKIETGATGNLYATQYDNLINSGTLAYEYGDRSAYSENTKHWFPDDDILKVGSGGKGELESFSIVGLPDVTNPVIAVGVGSDSNIREIGNILYEPDDIYRPYKIFYTGYNAGITTDEKIHYAYSQDGKTWTKSASNPVINARRAEDPYVVRRDKMYYLYAEDKEAGGEEYIRRWHSSDCINWVDDGQITGITKTQSPTVWMSGDTWYMLYEQYPTLPNDIRLATSSDGLVWTAEASNPVFSAGDTAWVTGAIVPDDIIRIGGTYYLLYHGNQTGTVRAGIAKSTDLLTWTDLNSPITSAELGDPIVTSSWLNDTRLTIYYYTVDTSGIYRGFPSNPVATINSGAITIDGDYYIVKAETGTADDLATISGPQAFQMLILTPYTGHTITLKHGTGNIYFADATDFVLSGTKSIILFFDGTNWTNAGGGILSSGSLALDDLSDVDTTGVGTGDIIYKTAGDWEDYPLGVSTAIVNDGSSIKLGDISGGNFLQIDTGTGEIALAGTATAWEDLRVEPTVRAAAGAGVPSFEKYFDDVLNTSKGVYLYSFTDESVAGNEKEIFFTMQMPHAWKLGTDISLHVHFVPAATVNSSDIIWGLEYVWKGIGEVFGDTVIVYSSTTLMPDDANITAGKHYLAEFTDLSPGTTASSLSSILIGRLFRNSSAGGDTYTNKVGLLYIDAHYQVDSFGSFDEYDKTMDSSLLLETGDVLLLETGDALLLE